MEAPLPCRADGRRFHQRSDAPPLSKRISGSSLCQPRRLRTQPPGGQLVARTVVRCRRPAFAVGVDLNRNYDDGKLNRHALRPGGPAGADDDDFGRATRQPWDDFPTGGPGASDQVQAQLSPESAATSAESGPSRLGQMVLYPWASPTAGRNLAEYRRVGEENKALNNSFRVIQARSVPSAGPRHPSRQRDLLDDLEIAAQLQPDRTRLRHLQVGGGCEPGSPTNLARRLSASDCKRSADEIRWPDLRNQVQRPGAAHPSGLGFCPSRPGRSLEPVLRTPRKWRHLGVPAQPDHAGRRHPGQVSPRRLTRIAGALDGRIPTGFSRKRSRSQPTRRPPQRGHLRPGRRAGRPAPAADPGKGLDQAV